MKLSQLAVVLVFGCSNAVRTAESEFPPHDYVPYLDAVAVLAEDGNLKCAGTFLPDGRVLTAAHCLDISNNDLTRDVASRQSYENKLFYEYRCDFYSLSHDVAILTAETGPRYHSTLDISPFDVEYGEPVFAIGHPAGLEYSVSYGVISNPLRIWGRSFVTQADVDVWRGNSGGPLISQGGLVGVASFIVADREHLAFFVARGAIKNAIRSAPNCKNWRWDED